MKSENNLVGLGILTAISASLCCITPVLVLLAGTSGLAATFSWLDPLRPYLIGLTVLVLGFAWYQKLKPEEQMDCNCDTNEKAPFIQTKKFLGIVTVFAMLMLAFPMYAHVFYPKSNTHFTPTGQSSIQTVEFYISGMTCSGCEEHVHHEINQLYGIVNTTVSYQNGKAVVQFDQVHTDMEKIEQAISRTEYTITDKKIIE